MKLLTIYYIVGLISLLISWLILANHPESNDDWRMVAAYSFLYGIIFITASTFGYLFSDKK